MLSPHANLMAATAFAICIGMSACALLPGPNLHNLKLASVNTIDRNQPADVASGIESPWPDRPVLVVNFTAERDLAAYAKQYEYNIGNDMSFCQDDEMDVFRELQNDPYIFDAAGKVDAYRKNSFPKFSAPDSVTYHIYVAIKPVQLAGRTIFDYDLRSNPEDICIQLRGGNMLGDTFTSNIIVVPKAAIIAALADR